MNNEAPHIYGVHDWDRNWGNLVKSAGKTAWCVVSIEIGFGSQDLVAEDFSALADYGVTVIGRLNWSHHGQGTIPTKDKYGEFSKRCATYVARSKGCSTWIIGNEPNMKIEQPGVPITPDDYAVCFNLCRTAIRNIYQDHKVLTAAVAPYNIDSGSWILYFRQILDAVNHSGGADGIALHTYSRGTKPEHVYSDDKMDYPYEGYSNGFRAYQDFLSVVPREMRGLYAYITETDQNDLWADTNNAWVQAAYAEINNWNQKLETQKIKCLVLYRWSTDDKWNFSQKPGVVEDFKKVLASTDYRWPAVWEVKVPEITGPRLVVNAPAGAQVRKGPGTNYPTIGAVPFGSVFKVTGRNTASSWWRAETLLGTGWISGTISIVQDISAVPVIAFTDPPPTPKVIDKDWLINSWSRVLGVDEKVVRAILAIESGGRGFENGKMVIRFENHIFLSQIRRLSPSLESAFNEHFRFGSPSYTGHELRVNGNWEKQHDGGQAEEWVVFNYARILHAEAAMLSISMGSGQVMGFNYGIMGYRSVQEMFDHFNDAALGEYNQLSGFFSYLVNRGGLLSAVQAKNWEYIASSYNGTGGVSQYAPLLRQKYLELGGL